MVDLGPLLGPVAVAVAIPALGQRVTATVRGRVVTAEDAQVVGGAQVTLRGQETGLVRTSVTNASGNYNIGDLPAVVAEDGDEITYRFARSDQTQAGTISGIVQGVVTDLATNGMHPGLDPSTIITGPAARTYARRDVANAPVSRAPPHAPPETIRHGTLTERSNVYTLGVILRELVGDHIAGAERLSFADTLARFVGQKLSDKFGQSVVIENRGGAGGNTAAAAVAKTEPDGYTILVITTAMAINASLYEKLNYSINDLTPIAMPGSSAETFAVSSESPPR